MRKRLLLTVITVLSCMGIYAQSVGDFVRTSTGKYKITGSNIITNGDFSNGLTGWKSGSGNALSTDSFTVVDNGGPVNSGPYIKSLFNTADSVGGAIHNAWKVGSNKTYILSYYTKSETATGTSSYDFCYQNMDGSTDKTSATGYDDTGLGKSVSFSTSWKQITYAFTSTNGYAAIHFYWLGNRDFANFFLGEATEVANTDSLQGEINIAQAYHDNAIYLKGKEELAAAIDNAKADLTNTDINAVVAAIQTLQTAVTAYINANSIDITSRITNASFPKLSGWTINKGGWKMNTKATYSSTSGNSVNYFCEAWTGSGNKLSNGDISQTINNLPAGLYVLTADVNACQQKDAALVVSGMKLYMNNDSVACATGNGAFVGYRVESTLSSIGNLKLGMNLNNTDGNWVSIDNFKLIYVGDTAEFKKEISNIDAIIAQKALQVMVDSAKTVYAWDKYLIGKQVLQDSINIESALTSSTDLTALANALTYMRNAINAYFAANKVLFALQDEVAKAQAFYDDADYKNGKDALKAAIDDASQYLTNTDITVIAQADTTLQKAELAFALLNASYKHPANICVNGTMTNMNGWTVLSGGTDNPYLHINASGSAGANVSEPFMECWVASKSSAQATYGQANYAYQEMTNLPAGLYTLKAAVNACNQGYTDPSAITGVNLFVNVGEEAHTINCATANGDAQYYTIEVEPTSACTLRFGLNIDAATTANWVAWDNVTMMYYGDPATYRKDSVQATLTMFSDSLKKEIDTATKLFNNVTNPNGVDVSPLENAIEDANNVLVEATSADDYNQAITFLIKAENAFKASGVFPPEGEYFDMTSFIKDANVDKTGIEAWTSDNTAVTDTPRRGTWYKATNENFHQTIEGLPNGDYMLEVKAFHRNAWYVTTAYYDTAIVKSMIYANKDSIFTKGIAYDATIVPLLETLASKYSLSKFDLTHCGVCMDTLYNRGYYLNTVPFTMTDDNAGSATIGILVNEGATNGNFTGWCDFRLRFYGKIPTGINPIVADNKKNGVINNNVYSITGTLVRSNAKNLEGLAKGLYIVNGKKYIVK